MLKHNQRGHERWLSSYKYWVFLQKVVIPSTHNQAAPTTFTIGFTESDALFWPWCTGVGCSKLNDVNFL